MRNKRHNVDAMRKMIMIIMINKEMVITMNNTEERKRIRIIIMQEIREILNNIGIMITDNEENK